MLMRKYRIKILLCAFLIFRKCTPSILGYSDRFGLLVSHEQLLLSVRIASQTTGQNLLNLIGNVLECSNVLVYFGKNKIGKAW